MKNPNDQIKTPGAEGPPDGAAAPQDISTEPQAPAPKPPPPLPPFFMLSHLEEDGPVRLDGVKLGVCEVMGLELDEPKLGAFAGALNACDFPVQLLIRQHPPRLGGLREELREAQPQDLPPQTRAAAESLRRLLTDLEARDGILDRRFYAVCEFGRFDELRGLLARAGLSVHPFSGRRLRMLMLASALGGTPAEMDEETPVEVEMRRREVRVGDRLVRSLHLGKWPRSLAPGFLQSLMAAGAPMDLSIHLGSIPAEQAARTLEWQKVRFESAQSLSFKRGRTMSPEAEIALEDVTRLRDEVQRGRERLFHASLSITLHAKDEASLKEMTQRAKAHFAATLGKLDPLAFRQREGILSTLPLALNAVAEWRTLDTSSIARLFPFSPPDLDTRRGTLYGIDMRACAPVVYDPWDGTHLNANTAVLARSGSGKSFATKLGMLRGLTRGVTAYVIDPEGEYADMARAAGGRVLSPGIPGQGMNPFVIDKGDSEELLQRIGSLRRLIEVMVGESLGAERRASLDHALAGYYAQPSRAHRLPRLLRVPARRRGGRERHGEAAAALRNGQPAQPPLRRGRRPAVQRGPDHRLRPAPAGAGASPRRRDGLHRDGVGRRRPGPQAEAAGGGRGVVDHAAPGGSGLHGEHGEAGQEAPAGVAVHHPGRPGPAQRGHLAGHHRPLRSRPASERRLQIAASAGRSRHQHRGRRLRPAPGPPAMAPVVPAWRRVAAGEGQPLPRPHRGHPGGDGGHRVETRSSLGATERPQGERTDRERSKRMKVNPIKWLLNNEAKKPPALLAVTPPRTGERTLLGVENMLGSIAVPEPFSLELAGDADGVTLLARCLDDQVVRAQIAARYPQAQIQEIPAEDDPLRLAEDEQAWSMTLRADGPEYVPLRVFRDDDLLDPGSDPLISLLGALSNLNEGERIVARLMLRSMGPDWSESHLEKAHKRPVEDRRDPAYTYQTKPLQTDGVTMAVLGVAALAVVRGYMWVQAGETWKAVLMGAGVAFALAVGGWAWHRWKKARKRVFDPILIKEKVSRIAFDAEIKVTAILPRSTRPHRAKELLAPVAAAYRDYDNPAGARLDVSRVRPAVADPQVLHPSGPGLFGKRSVMGVREAACLWHPPGARDETPLVARAGAKVLLPTARSVSGGAHVGDTTTGTPRKIHFPDDLLRRHHLYVARTRMGKSTLMHHIVAHKMREKAAGRDGDAIVVVDPHADLVGGLLQHVPESLIEQVRLIDLADERGAPGINLLDTRIFADRDRTADSVVRIAKGLWDQWGPRMQSILEQTVKTLHEANESRDAGEQYTILDGLRILADDGFRAEVLAKVNDPYLMQWWARDFFGWRRETRADALAPVQTRLSYYASSKRARAILGQPRSTIDMRRTIQDGGILLVSTAQGKAGRDVAALVGASLLNLVDAVIREQGSLPFEQRRGALVVVDEMQSMPGVDYESMLSELGKFGASFVLATQSLAKLDDLSRTMRDTLLANVGCLAVFQVAGNDARQLVWELGKERVTEDDITSLPVHQCYVRATVGTERMDAFSMKVAKPETGDAGTAERIRDLAESYLTPASDIDRRDAEMQDLVDRYREELEKLRKGQDTQTAESGGQSQEQARRKQRSKRDQNPGDDALETPDGTADEELEE